MARPRPKGAPEPSPDLSHREARRLALKAQGLIGPRLSGGPLAMLHRLRAVQIDTISVLARSHELVAYARLGRLPREQVEDAYWGRRPGADHNNAFEYWSHAACILPMETWPFFAFRRSDRRARGRRWHPLEDADRVCKSIREKLLAEGPLTARQLGGAKKGGPWWDWSDVKIGAEWMLDVGDVVCVSRVGFQRVYDLPERAVPPHLLDLDLLRSEQISALVSAAVRALGVATAGDVAAYCGLSNKEAAATLGALELEQVTVEGWSRPAFAHKADLDGGAKGLRSRPVILSPFDSTIWHRPRLEHLFGFHHRLEAYVPRHLRVHGYYSMPLLVGDELVGSVDPKRSGRTLLARKVRFESERPRLDVVEGAASALVEAAGWVGGDSVALEAVVPPEAEAGLCGALRSRGALAGG